MSRLFVLLSAFVFSSMPNAWAQDGVPEEALEHSIDKTVAQEEVHKGHTGGLPQFDLTTWPKQIFWLFISFIILYIFFSKVILPSLTSTIKTRENKIEGDIKTAEELSYQADQIRLGYESELKKASQKASAGMKAIDEEAKAKLSKSLAEFRTRYETEVRKVEVAIDQAKTAALSDMQTIAADIAAQAAEKIAGIPADKAQAETVVQSIKNKAA